MNSQAQAYDAWRTHDAEGESRAVEEAQAEQRGRCVEWYIDDWAVGDIVETHGEYSAPLDLLTESDPHTLCEMLRAFRAGDDAGLTDKAKTLMTALEGHVRKKAEEVGNE